MHDYLLHYLANMNKEKKIAIILGIVLVIAGVAFFIIGLVNPKSAGIRIETNPNAQVFINGEQVGRTPYMDTVKPGEITVKLVPDLTDKPLSPYETKVSLAGGIQTVIIRNFAELDELASGAIISFIKESAGSALSVISMPDAAQITIDGLAADFTPYKTSTIAEGDHLIEANYPGYITQSQNVHVVKGYNLTVFFSLAVDPNKPKQEEAKNEEKQKPSIQVEILATSTGFLRVRKEPSTQGDEIVQVKPGEKYDLIEESEDGKWLKISVDATTQGFVSAAYTKVIEKIDDVNQ